MSSTYFNKRTTDEIVTRERRAVLGLPGCKLVNLGEVENEGIEWKSTLKLLDRRSLSWDIGGTLGTAKDLIKANIPTIVASGGQANLVGYPIGGIFSAGLCGLIGIRHEVCDERSLRRRSKGNRQSVCVRLPQPFVC